MNIKSAYLYVILFLTSFSGDISAQVIDNTSTFKRLPGKTYFRFQYDNDYFTKEDRYYSQGISFELVHAGLKKNPLTALLLKPAHSEMTYGIGLNIFGYTPTSILSETILYGDRPYASIIALKTFSTATDAIHKRQISSAVILGVIGPAALGNEIQTNIHRWLKNPLPKGWNTQVQNDVVLNYQVNYEKQLLAASGNFLLNGVGELRIGTLDDKVSGGVNFMAGNFNERYAGDKKPAKKVEYYFYAQGRAHVIGYDASLQGGLINKHDPYVIRGSDVERLVFQADAGIVVNFKKIFLSYSQSFISREFVTGKRHRWGGINIGFAF